MPLENQEAAHRKLEAANTSIYPGLKIESTEWISKDSLNRVHSTLILRVACAEMANRLIERGLIYKYSFKTVDLYEQTARIQQYIKCQGYGHFHANCTSQQRCAHCAQGHRSDTCAHKDKKHKEKWKCAVCGGNHKTFTILCTERREEWERVKFQLATKSRYHPITRSTQSRNTREMC